MIVKPLYLLFGDLQYGRPHVNLCALKLCYQQHQWALQKHVTSFYKPHQMLFQMVVSLMCDFLVIHRHFCGKCQILITLVKKNDFIIEDKHSPENSTEVFALLNIWVYIGFFACLCVGSTDCGETRWRLERYPCLFISR